LEIQQRMLDQQSNASRLVDRLVNKGLAQRVICKEDRRKMDVSITNQGLKLLNDVMPQIDEEHGYLVGLSEEEQKEANELLDKMRTKKEGEINV
jgi:DNA-binding MarR family transcriptional regulator